MLVTKYVIKSNTATDPVTKWFFIKSNIGDPTLEIWLKDEAKCRRINDPIVNFFWRRAFFLFEVKVYQKL